MFQIGTNWQLWDLPRGFETEIKNITLRGYRRDDPVLLPAEFSLLRPLSVDDICSLYCPTRRDLFLLRVRGRRGSATWGRIVGPVIEEYCKGLIGEYHNLFESAPTQSYVSVNRLIEEFTNRFITRKERQFQKLNKHSSGTSTDATKLVLVLQYTGRYELAMLGADWLLNDGGAGKAASLFMRVPLEHENIEISPDERAIGIRSPSTPDFLISSLQAIGDIKSGGVFKDFYRLSCAGYAIAYENQHGAGNEINFGIIYFFETHSKNIGVAKSYAFLIDDQLRQEFLDRRNEAFGIIKRDPSDPPPLASRDQYCIYCKYQIECDKDRNGN